MSDVHRALPKPGIMAADEHPKLSCGAEVAPGVEWTTAEDRVTCEACKDEDPRERP